MPTWAIREHLINIVDKADVVDKGARSVITCAGQPGSPVMPAFTSHYARIVADLTGQIDRGDLQPDDKLPSTRELAEHYGVSETTVRNVIRFLLGTGVLRGHQGLGVFVAERPGR